MYDRKELIAGYIFQSGKFGYEGRRGGIRDDVEFEYK